MPGRLKLKSVTACEQHRWSVVLAPNEPGADTGPRAMPFACKSWRCRRCGWWVARDDLARVTAGATSREWWVYLVLTFDPRDYACGWDAYRDAVERFEVLRRSLQRRYGRVEYLQTWERHVRASALPHANVLLRAPGLRAAVEGLGVDRVFDERAGHGAGRWTLFPRAWRRDWLQPHTDSAGFGRRVWCEVVSDAGGMAAYLAKAANDLGAARWKAGDQTPIGAPPHFRRLRASRGILPPRPKPEGLWTGAVARERLDGELAWSEFEALKLAADAARAWSAGRPAREPEYERAAVDRSVGTA